MAAKVIIIIVLLLLSGYFSASETALSSASRIRLKSLIAGGDRRASRTLAMIEDFDKTLTTILVGNNIVNIASSSLATVMFTELFGPAGVGAATVVMTILVLVFGEVLPKSVAKENAEPISLVFSGPLSVLARILTPVTWLFSQLKKGLSRLMRTGGQQPSVTEDELKFIIDESEEQGVLEEQESNLVKSALEFDDIEVSRILVPRVNVVAVEVNQSIEDIRNVFMEEMYTRMPVYEKNIDNIIGVINEKDFLRLLVEGSDSVQDIITETMYISDRKLISEVLRDMQKSKVHMAIVLDQYGGTQGIVTMEDIIEELVGEIYDENDEIISPLQKVSENCWDVEADLSVTDLLEELDLPEDLIETERNSVGGWSMELFGRIPERGAEITNGLFSIKILEVGEQRVKKIRLTIDMAPKNSEIPDSKESSQPQS